MTSKRYRNKMTITIQIENRRDDLTTKVQELRQLVGANDCIFLKMPKELEKIPLESESYSKAVKVLTELYCLICEACNYYIFSTEDAVRSMGWEQPDLFEFVVKKTFAVGNCAH